MKKLLLILLFFSIVNYAQDLQKFRTCDLFINELLKNSINFIVDKRSTKPDFKFYLENQNPTINWNKNKLMKWQITDKENFRKIDSE